MTQRGRRIITVILLTGFLVGILMALYPDIADYWNRMHQAQAIYTYADTVSNLNDEDYEAIWQEALDYNEALSQKGTMWAMTDEEREEYNALLNVDGTGNMGYIDIPKIGVTLPMYHGTTESVLQTSVGHIEGTSLPCGSRDYNDDVTRPVWGSHSVLSGHRGLPSAKLFSDLDQLVEGDIFILTVLDQTLTYEVDQIRIVEPSDVSALAIEPEMDLCTLVTCTPYGVPPAGAGAPRGKRAQDRHPPDRRRHAHTAHVRRAVSGHTGAGHTGDLDDDRDQPRTCAPQAATRAGAPAGDPGNALQPGGRRPRRQIRSTLMELMNA